MKFLSNLSKLFAKDAETTAQLDTQKTNNTSPNADVSMTSWMSKWSAEWIDYVEWIAMIGLIVFSLSYFLTALNKPINTAQYQMIESYSQNNRYPDTQIYAKALILHNKANQYDYLRLMYKVQNEHGNIHFRRNESATH